MPTILSTWKLSYTVESGDRDLTRYVLNPATNLMIIGKVKLRFLPNAYKRLALWHHRDEAFDEGCSTGNKYRPEVRDRTCVPCPSQLESPTDLVANLR